jgi:hypothetical protein
VLVSGALSHGVLIVREVFPVPGTYPRLPGEDSGWKVGQAQVLPIDTSGVDRGRGDGRDGVDWC